MKSFKTWNYYVFISLFLILAGCGGGGGGGGGGDSAPAAQSLLFAQAGPVSASPGEILSNAATGPGTGSVTYSSSNMTVATVDNGGLVTVVGEGTAVITANKAADARYLAASASFTLNAVLSHVAMAAWIGANRTLVSLPAIDGVDLYRSSAPNCDLSSYASCADGQMDHLDGIQKVDTAATYSRPGYYTLKKGGREAALTVSSSQLNTRWGHQIVTFHDRLWFFGGASGDNLFTSTDGETWTKQTTIPALPDRVNSQVVVFNDQLWMIGGKESFAGTHDVWSSSDGIHWTQQTANAGFSGRSLHQLVVYNSRLWLIGGEESSGFGNSVLKNDVWSSSDGVNWTQHTAAAPFSARGQHRAIVSNGELLVIGGYDGAYINDIWSSADGTNWTQRTQHGAFSARGNFALTRYNNQLWLIGGTTTPGALSDDVWVSSDGINWNRHAEHTGFGVRTGAQAVSYADQLWVIGGARSVSGPVTTADVWSSTDGTAWKEHSANAAFSPREGHQVAVFNNQLWLLGGYGSGSGDNYYKDVWSSGDGITWTRRVVNGAFSARMKHQLVSFNNQLWLIGGATMTGSTNDIWSSSDGVTWTQRSVSAAFSARYGHRVLNFNGKLWLIGGSTSTAFLNDIWSSTDGVSWIRETANAAFPARYGFSVSIYNNKLWLSGGYDGTSNLSDIWSSSDGTNWTQQTPNVQFTDHFDAQFEVFAGQLWRVGSSSSSFGADSEIWSSTNGIGWTKMVVIPGAARRYAHQLVAFNNRLYLIGGKLEYESLNDVWSSDDGLNWTKGFRATFDFH